MDVIMRNDVVESVRAGDKMVFTGSLVVVPDISAVTAPGERVETRFGVRRLRPLSALPCDRLNVLPSTAKRPRPARTSQCMLADR